MQTQEQTNPATDHQPASYTPPAHAGLACLSIEDLFALVESAATHAATIIAAAPAELRQGLAAACSQSLFALVEQLDGGLAAAA